jgi:nucleoside-diphosphate-sugar epimerase
VTVPRVAVAGASGFIGRHVSQALADAGHEALLLARSRPVGVIGRWRALPTEGTALRDLLRAESVGVLVNCAGATRGSAAELEAANVALVTRLLHAVADANVRFVQVGSAAEYGPGDPGKPVREDHDGNPPSEYGISKRAATDRVVAAGSAGGVLGVVLRVFNPIGAGVSPDSLPGRAAQLIRDALPDRAVHLGPLGMTRDFVDVRDVADAVVTACAAELAPGLVLNIGSGRGTTARELIRELASVAGHAGPILEDAAGSPRSDAIEWQVADIGAARSALDWAPRRSLREAVAALWEAG